MTVNPTDKFLVNRSGSSYHVDQQDLMAQLEDDDLLLVNRNSKSYKITGAEFKDSLSSPPIIQSVTLTEDDPAGARFTSQDFTTTAVMLDNGTPASTKSIRGWVEGSLTEKIETDEITAVDTSTSPVYSARMTGTPDVGYPFTNIFDGSRSTWCSANNTDLTFRPSPAIPFKKIEIYYPSADDTTHSVDVNGNPATITYVGNSWVELKGIAHGDLTSLVMKGDRGGYCGGIRIDGLELIDNKTTTALTFASDKDLAKLQSGDHIQQEDADYSSTELSELNPSDTVGGSITEEGLKFTSTITSAWSRSYVGVDEDEKVQFEMTYLSGQGALIGFSLAGSDGAPGPGIIGAVYDSDGTIRFTGDYPGTPASSGYGGGKTVGATIDNATGVVNFYLEGEFVGTCTLEPNQNLLLYVHANRGEVKANFGKDGFKYPVEGFANFERYEPSGTVASIDVAGNSLTMSKSYGAWGPANAGHYAIGPSTIVDGAKKYLNLDASLNVIGLTDDDSYTRTPGNTTTPKISFPATLDNGEAPDAALPDGTSIQTEILAENTAGSDEMVSNVVTPSPSCISGPIETDVITNVSPDGLTLTFSGDKNLAKLQPGDYIEQENTSGSGQVYSQYADNSNMVRDWQSAFDGNLSTNAASYADAGMPASTLEINPSIKNITSLRIYLTNASGLPNTDAFWINGDTVSITDGSGWNTITGIKEIRSISLGNYGDGATRRSTDVHAIEVNGQILEDGTGREPRGIVGSVNVAGNSLTLASSNGTWGPANANPGHYAIGPDYICPPITLDADDPDDVETFYAIKAALVQYESERDEFRQQLIDALVAAGFTTNQIAAYIDEE